jgi:hypothetical protein
MTAMYSNGITNIDFAISEADKLIKNRDNLDEKSLLFIKTIIVTILEPRDKIAIIENNIIIRT